MSNRQYYQAKINAYGLKKIRMLTDLNEGTLKAIATSRDSGHEVGTLVAVAWVIDEKYHKFVKTFVPNKAKDELHQEYQIDRKIENLFSAIIKSGPHHVIRNPIYHLLVQALNHREYGGGYRYNVVAQIKSLDSLTSIFNYYMPRLVRCLSFSEKRAFYLALAAIAARYTNINISFDKIMELVDLPENRLKQ